MTDNNANDWQESANAVTDAVQQGENNLRAAVEPLQTATATMTGRTRDGLAFAFGTGLEGGQIMLSTLKTGTETFTASMEAGFSRATEGLTALNGKAVDILRENVNASFELWERMIGARTMLQAMELQSDHARKRIELLGEQSHALAVMAGQVAARSLEPSQAAARTVASASL